MALSKIDHKTSAGLAFSSRLAIVFGVAHRLAALHAHGQVYGRVHVNCVDLARTPASAAADALVPSDVALAMSSGAAGLSADDDAVGLVDFAASLDIETSLLEALAGVPQGGAAAASDVLRGLVGRCGGGAWPAAAAETADCSAQQRLAEAEGATLWQGVVVDALLARQALLGARAAALECAAAGASANAIVAAGGETAGDGAAEAAAAAGAAKSASAAAGAGFADTPAAPAGSAAAHAAAADAGSSAAAASASELDCTQDDVAVHALRALFHRLEPVLDAFVRHVFQAFPDWNAAEHADPKGVMATWLYQIRQAVGSRTGKFIRPSSTLDVYAASSALQHCFDIRSVQRNPLLYAANVRAVADDPMIQRIIDGLARLRETRNWWAHAAARGRTTQEEIVTVIAAVRTLAADMAECTRRSSGTGWPTDLAGACEDMRACCDGLERQVAHVSRVVRLQVDSTRLDYAHVLLQNAFREVVCAFDPLIRACRDARVDVAHVRECFDCRSLLCGAEHLNCRHKDLKESKTVEEIETHVATCAHACAVAVRNCPKLDIGAVEHHVRNCSVCNIEKNIPDGSTKLKLVHKLRNALYHEGGGEIVDVLQALDAIKDLLLAPGKSAELVAFKNACEEAADKIDQLKAQLLTLAPLARLVDEERSRLDVHLDACCAACPLLADERQTSPMGMRLAEHLIDARSRYGKDFASKPACTCAESICMRVDELAREARQDQLDDVGLAADARAALEEEITTSTRSCRKVHLPVMRRKLKNDDADRQRWLASAAAILEVFTDTRPMYARQPVILVSGSGAAAFSEHGLRLPYNADERLVGRTLGR